jgi:adenosylcobyric acid synthase
VVAWPRLANATDVEPLLAEPGVAVRAVTSASQLGHPHLVVLPGTKATVADLAWLRASGLAAAIGRLDPRGTTVLGICGGLQVLGSSIVDEGVESGSGRVDGLGRLDVTTSFEPEKLVLAHPDGTYEIRHGRLSPDLPWHESADGAVWGTPRHGVLDDDARRAELLGRVAARAGVTWTPSAMCWAEHRRAHHDRLADWLEAAVDVDSLVPIGEGAAAP